MSHLSKVRHKQTNTDIKRQLCIATQLTREIASIAGRNMRPKLFTPATVRTNATAGIIRNSRRKKRSGRYNGIFVI